MALVQLEEFLDDELGPLLRFARALIGDRGTAEDVVQDVVTRLLSRRDLFADIDSPRAYVRRMVVNEYTSWGRKWFRITPVADPLGAGRTIDPVDVVGERDELRSELSRLPRNQRAVLVMRYYLQLGDDEIARTLGCSTVTVRSHASRALAALRVLSESERTGHGPSHS